MNYQEWEQNAPADFTGDPLWKVEAYRLSLFVAELGRLKKLSNFVICDM
ncbi:MAG: hypothetical protein KJ077_47215 [Anaerolineae bacterium]|nr:hypothetical protein [Anaerolineae bacterium]